jgi:hypothetical protein
MLVGTFDYLDRVSKHLLGPVDQRAGVATIHEHRLDGAEEAEQPHQHGTGRHPVLDAGRVYDHRQQVALRVYRDVPLAPLDLFARFIPAPPPFSAVLADCESIIATVGVAFRPCALRPCSRSVLPTRSHTRPWRQARNC